LDVLPYAADSWQRVAADWCRLESRINGLSAFVSARWVGAWWRAFAAQLRPEILRWRNERDDVVALVIVSTRIETRGPVRFRAAYLNATGDRIVESEHNRLLCLPELRARVQSDLARRLRQLGVQLLCLPGFCESEVRALRPFWSAGESVDGFASDDRFVPLSALRGQQPDFLQTLSSNTRQQIRRSLRQYERALGATPAVELASSTAQALAWFDELTTLHSARWLDHPDGGAFTSAAAREMHRQLIAERPAAMQPCGDVGVHILRVHAANQTIGMLYNLVKDGQVSFYQSGLKYEADNKLKPGLVSHALAIQCYLDAGFDEYDFLAGEATPSQYKVSLGSETRRLTWLELYRPGIKSTSLRIGRRIKRSMQSRAAAKIHNLLCL
jgi:hypothetical protein